MDIYTAAIVVSILAYIAIGNYAGRKVKSIEDYYVAGRQAPTVLVVGTLVASALSTITMYAGSKGVVITDTVMFLLFTIAAFFALVYLVDAQGGWTTAMGGLAQIEEKPDLLSWHGVVGPGTE